MFMLNPRVFAKFYTLGSLMIISRYDRKEGRESKDEQGEGGVTSSMFPDASLRPQQKSRRTDRGTQGKTGGKTGGDRRGRWEVSGRKANS